MSSSSSNSLVPDRSTDGSNDLTSSQNLTSSSSGTHSGTGSSQADTVPVDHSDNSPPLDEVDSLKATNAWGILYPINCDLYKTIHIETDVFMIGRDSCCEYQICKKDGFDKLPELTTTFSNISKKHFKIFRENDDTSIGYSVRLEDLSSNGTYVNRIRVGQGRRCTLMNTSRISLAGKDNEAFIFVDVKVMLKEQNQLPTDFRKKYCLERERLGSGAHGVVRRGRANSSDMMVAVKMIEKNKHSDFTKDVHYEASLMRCLDHPNIVTIHDVFDSDDMLYIVLEFVMGGELFDYITSKGCIKEDLAKLKFKDLLNAVLYLHGKNIIHRDIKPENILLTSKDIHTCDFKITDFGLSRLVGDQSLMRTICGTPGYTAPEILHAGQTGYTGAVDVWSLGCVLYIMLSGLAPFNHSDMEAIKTGDFSFSNPIWMQISCSAKDLIKKMLQVSPVERIPITDVHSCEWYFQETSLSNIKDPTLKRKLPNSEENNAVKRKFGY